MSGGVRVDVDASELIAALNRLDGMAHGADIGRALMAGALVVEGEAKQNIIRYDFIDTGATLNSTAAEQVAENEAHIGPATDYAIYGELGTRFTPPKPFMREAIENNKAAIMDAVKEELREALRRAVR